jgi:hypothetical protein
MSALITEDFLASLALVVIRDLSDPAPCSTPPKPQLAALGAAVNAGDREALIDAFLTIRLKHEDDLSPRALGHLSVLGREMKWIVK